MADLQFPANLAAQPSFIRRVQSAIVDAAIAIQTEDPATVNHAARRTLGNKVLLSPASYAPLFAPGVADNAAVQADFTTDGSFALANGKTEIAVGSDIQFQVNSIWNAYT